MSTKKVTIDGVELHADSQRDLLEAADRLQAGKDGIYVLPATRTVLKIETAPPSRPKPGNIVETPSKIQYLVIPAGNSTLNLGPGYVRLVGALGQHFDYPADNLTIVGKL